ncbi:hypothetical protein CAPTEDRAFT_34938, partial [Capitella teleta]
ETVGVLGSGDYGRAFCARLVAAGVPAAIGSRDPSGKEAFLSAVQPQLKGVPVIPTADCLLKCNPILLAIGASDHAELKVYEDHLEGKVLIDVSNPPCNSSELSQAERIQELLPKSHVVKAFNTISAYALNDNDICGESRSVCVCANDLDTRRKVCELVAKMGLTAVDAGSLVNARKMERGMQTLFPGWGKPLVFTACSFTLWTLYAVFRYFMVGKESVDQFFAFVLNKVCACMALTMLAMCFLPGCVVAIIQLARGTKYKALPSWICSWMQMRKYVGIYGLFFALVHMCLSLALLQPAYLPYWFKTSGVSIPANHTSNVIVGYSSTMSWLGELILLLGVLALALYTILGLSSIPSIGRTFNWREWYFIYSCLGLFCLAMSCAHVTLLSYKGWIFKSPAYNLQTFGLLSQLLPYFVLAVRLVLLLPCINTRLTNIRRG